ncbi:MAG: CoA transferase [Paracoccaceae bacterium]
MSAAHRIGQTLTDMLSVPGADWDRVQITETPTGLATRMPIADMATAAQGLVGHCADAVWQARGGAVQQVTVDRWTASLSMTASAYLTVDGKKATSWDPLTGYHRTADGWVYTHCQFAHLRDGLLTEFGLPNDPETVKAAFAQLQAQEIEDRAAAAGVCAIRRRSRSEWDAHPHAAELQSVQVLQLARHGDVPARPLGQGGSPLEGVRVLDLSRVIAGPMIGRTLAEHGAEVLRIAGPHLPSFDSLVINTGFGKRSAFVDLRTPHDVDTLRDLIRDADVLIDGYRPGALAARGLSFSELRALNPSIVYVTLSAFGETGPWGGRRGYDTYVQAATGLSAEGADGPTRLPCQPLDYLGGYLGASAAMAALARRSAEGGAWRAELSLARNAMWIWEWTDVLGAEKNAPQANPTPEEVNPIMTEMGSSFGHLHAMRPAVSLSETPPKWRSAPVPLGSHAAEWTTLDQF